MLLTWGKQRDGFEYRGKAILLSGEFVTGNLEEVGHGF
jgi:hypothetical protein